MFTIQPTSSSLVVDSPYYVKIAVSDNDSGGTGQILSASQIVKINVLLANSAPIFNSIIESYTI